MLERFIQMLNSAYGLEALSFSGLSPGWSAAAWKVQTRCGDFFLKVYDKQKPSTRVWVERLDAYMPVVLWLHQHTGLRDKMTAPVLTKTGSYQWADTAFIYMVFPLIGGQTIADAKLTGAQVRELAEIVAALHVYGAEIPVPTGSLRETFDVSFCGELTGWLCGTGDTDLNAVLAPYAGTLSRMSETLQAASDTLRKTDLRYALCHMDIHGWNLMQAERLILIDWEGLRLAPVEADLFSLTDTFFFDYARDEFITSYRSVHKDYHINPEVMRFYRWRRRLEDVHAFSQSILLDCLTAADRTRSLHYLNRECALLPAML
jgi:Ser/Thr protein kinase RdoA (MazF antagonist)